MFARCGETRARGIVGRALAPPGPLFWAVCGHEGVGVGSPLPDSGHTGATAAKGVQSRGARGKRGAQPWAQNAKEARHHKSYAEAKGGGGGGEGGPSRDVKLRAEVSTDGEDGGMPDPPLFWGGERPRADLESAKGGGGGGSHPARGRTRPAARRSAPRRRRGCACSGTWRPLVGEG